MFRWATRSRGLGRRRRSGNQLLDGRHDRDPDVGLRLLERFQSRPLFSDPCRSRARASIQIIERLKTDRG